MTAWEMRGESFLAVPQQGAACWEVTSFHRDPGIPKHWRKKAEGNAISWWVRSWADLGVALTNLTGQMHVPSPIHAVAHLRNIRVICFHV